MPFPRKGQSILFILEVASGKEVLKKEPVLSTLSPSGREK